MSTSITDVIDHLAGIDPGSHLDRVRSQRPEARSNAQASFEALFAPRRPGGFSAAERLAVAAFVTGLHQDAATAAFYAARLAEQAPELAAPIANEIEAGRTTGPYGAYPAAGPLAAESVAGPVYRAAGPDALGARLAAALEHAHLLVFRPRESSPEALQALADADWSATDVVTLSQLVAFLSFQVRAVVGLRLLAAAPRKGA
ncbi:CMD domain protein [Planosporangium thailandense]|uniref:CMD domain protein n=1 Tax=Planosporangium thailandense TaxID=765197 RepID=A0ABX0XXL5_9ACTN|nr:CMD domain protein [Planosporangium thailandense]NJC69904.1 CMD domain protein [Planosporangium thailandense]